MKRNKILPILLLAGLITSCGPTSNPSTPVDPSVDPSVEPSVNSPYTMKITAIGSTTIQVTKTLTLRTKMKLKITLNACLISKPLTTQV